MNACRPAASRPQPTPSTRHSPMVPSIGPMAPRWKSTRSQASFFMWCAYFATIDGSLQLPDVIEDVAPLDLPEAFEGRTVRVAFLIGKRVVLEVHGHPLGGHDAGRHPDAEPEHPLDRGMQHDCAMCRCAVQVDGRAEDRDLGDKRRHNERNDQGKQHYATLRQTRLLPGGPVTCGGCRRKAQW